MIPPNIERKHILKAIKAIDSDGTPLGRRSKKYSLIFEGRNYSPKYTVALANKFANGCLLASEKFSGGLETNSFLKRMGFRIRKTGLSKSETVLSRPVIEKVRHDERCPKCKDRIKALLEKIYSSVNSNYRFEVSTRIEDYKNYPFYQNLSLILSKLKNHRGHKNFIRSPVLPPCDFFVPEPGFIVEFDESQHFSFPRKISFENYPRILKLGFPLSKWVNLCEQIDARDNDPPFRDEQRAWYDTMRDFLPLILGMKPTVRLCAKEMQWCRLNPAEPSDLSRFRHIIGSKRKSGNWLATVILQSNDNYSNTDRVRVLSDVIEMIVKETEGDGVILFPGGFSVQANEKRKQYTNRQRIMLQIFLENMESGTSSPVLEWMAERRTNGRETR